MTIATQPANAPDLPSQAPEAVLIRQPDERRPFLLRRDCDTSMAIRRGLAQYLAARSITIGGDEFKLHYVLDDWADWERVQKFPAGSVFPEGQLSYDAHSTTPTIDPATKFLVPGDDRPRFLVHTTDAEQRVRVAFIASSSNERAILSAMVEEALSPVEWMYGLRLYLPFYFGAVAEYAMASSEAVDSQEAAAHRQWEQHFVVDARVPVYRARPIAESRPQARVGVDGITGPMVPRVR